MENTKLQDRARDELYSHINRCGVLQATGDDQEHWMEETIEYIGERYPDLSDSDLKYLREVGIRFCQPAIPHGGSDEPEDEAEAQPEAEALTDEVVSEEPIAVDVVPEEPIAVDVVPEEPIAVDVVPEEPVAAEVVSAEPVASQDESEGLVANEATAENTTV